jgi:hypothetical protein
MIFSVVLDIEGCLNPRGGAHHVEKATPWKGYSTSVAFTPN